MAQPRSVDDCPLCQGRPPDDLVRAIRSAKAGKPMTRDEFEQWLKQAD